MSNFSLQVNTCDNLILKIKINKCPNLIFKQRKTRFITNKKNILSHHHQVLLLWLESQ